MENTERKSKKFKIGIMFLISVIFFYAFAGITALIPLELQVKGIIITSLIIIAEVCFLISVGFLGKELVTKYKKKINPKNWFKKKE
ncbi:MAG: transporter suffix domain-containing protein [Staphylococcus pseudoxylosus]|uniref:transporter suffix domain-containing protein n=1 Tax=Staphylococcus pseudoxylosus TaxID=2282419 RepID=UPI0031F64B15